MSTASELKSSMNSVQIEQKSYEMPPREGFSIAHFLAVDDIERSARFYEMVFGGHILNRGDSQGAPAYVQIANTWLLVHVGGGPTLDKPTVTLSVRDPDKINGFMDIRVADIQACYKLWNLWRNQSYQGGNQHGQNHGNCPESLSHLRICPMGRYAVQSLLGERR